MIETYLPHNLLYGGTIVLYPSPSLSMGLQKDTGAVIGVINFTSLKHLLSCTSYTYTLELCERTPSYIQ